MDELDSVCNISEEVSTSEDETLVEDTDESVVGSKDIKMVTRIPASFTFPCALKDVLDGAAFADIAGLYGEDWLAFVFSDTRLTDWWLALDLADFKVTCTPTVELVSVSVPGVETLVLDEECASSFRLAVSATFPGVVEFEVVDKSTGVVKRSKSFDGECSWG